MFLREIENPITQLKGVGPKNASLFGRLGVTTVAQLLCHLPREYEDRKTPALFVDRPRGGTINTVVTVTGHSFFGHGRNRTLKVHVTDDTGEGVLVCFGRNFLADALPVNGRFRLWGQFEQKFGELQSSVFDTEPEGADSGLFGRILPVYPLTKGLGQKIVRRIMQAALSQFGVYVEDEIPASIRQPAGILSKADALTQLHFPVSVEEARRARRSLSFEELFYLQIVVGRRSLRRISNTRPAVRATGIIIGDVMKRLPFTLTGDQRRVVEEIRLDILSSRPMARLLQGDVGAGKTLVAFLSAAVHIEGGRQVACMAPTGLLAKQHADTAARILEPAGVKVAFLSGRLDDCRRKPLLEALRSGEIDLLIGTHALFSEGVEYRDLGMVIIDEQHRFGVMQRLELVEKGPQPDLLVMTATPIPRTLALTAFGDLDISTIREKPPGRVPVVTHLARIGNESKVYHRVRQEVDAGRQAFFVYPLIRDSEALAVKSAESMFEELQRSEFPGFNLGLIHSGVPEEEIQQTMEAFVSGRIDILVATTVVEVGVDVPNATCMVIEHAERFGLAALHQLRGRVGRSTNQSYAFLVYDPNLTETGKRRLKALMEQPDGFEIAETDLAIRGPGEVTGVRQSGVPSMVDWADATELLELARSSALALLRDDPGLLSPENERVRLVLHRCPPFETRTVGSG
jgi:ATP-dependent DNA helicase RecG